MSKNLRLLACLVVGIIWQLFFASYELSVFASSTSDVNTPSLISDMEVFGAWKRGNETWGTFTASGEQTKSGKVAGKLNYQFPATSNNYVVFRRSIPIAGAPTAITAWVHGDDSSNFLNLWVVDAKNQQWQFTFGQIKHSGWKQMTAFMDVNQGWPNQLISGSALNSPQLIYPVRFDALVLDGYREDKEMSGTIYIDDLYAVSGVPSVSATSLTPAASQNRPTSDSKMSAKNTVSQTTSISQVVPLAGALINFETWRTWTRGNQAYGTFTQSKEQVHSGRYSGKLIYNLPAVGDNFLVFRQTTRISGQPNAISAWIYGDGSKNFLNVWVVDANQQRWQFSFGQIVHTGWQQMSALLDIKTGWPNVWISGSNPSASSVVFPISLDAIVIDGYREDVPLSGTIYLDDLSVGVVNLTKPTPLPTTQSANVPAKEPTTSIPPANTVPATVVATCGSVDYESYDKGSIAGNPSQRPAATDPDINLAFHGYTSVNEQSRIVEYAVNSGTDGRAPQLRGLFSDKRIPAFTNTYNARGWNWDSFTPGNGLHEPWPVTVLGVGVNAGELILVPDAGYEIGGGYKVMVLYADDTQVTLKYTRNDGIPIGYGIQIDGLCVEPKLLALYRELNQNGRRDLPALRAGQAVGRAIGGEMRIAVRDNGQFMDPRSKNDWWR